MALLEERSLLHMSVYFYSGSTTRKEHLFIELYSNIPLESDNITAVEKIFDDLFDRFQPKQIPSIAAEKIVEAIDSINSAQVIQKNTKHFEVKLFTYPNWD